MKYLIIHGSFGSPTGNWFPRLKEKLTLLNQDVLVPKFPTDNWDELTLRGHNTTSKQQTLTNWLEVFKQQVLPWIGQEKVVIIAHSLAPLFVLHALTKYQISIDAAIFVSPFLQIPRQEKFWQIDVANQTFYQHDFDFNFLKKQIPVSFVLYSDGDPYVPITQAKKFAHLLNSSLIPVLGAKHLSSEFNQNEFPLVLELCKSRIYLTLYQKYLAHISEYHPTEVVKQGKDRALFMPTSELAKEGTFHFRNLEKNGFCTFPVAQVKFWRDEQSAYIDEGRKAASRVPITRVYIFENAVGKDQPEIKKIMSDDKVAGVHVYFCWRKELEIPQELLDFGIWDENYVCTVVHQEHDTHFILDSSQRRLAEARKQQEMILRVARIF